MSPSEVQRALDLRRAGVSWPRIAEQVGCSQSVARAAVKGLLGRSDLDEALEADRLDRLIEAVWPLASSGDLQAVDRVLKISEQRQRLLDPAPTGKGGQLAAALERTVAAAEVRDVDAALIEAARTIAERVDRAAAKGDGQELTKALYLLPHLTNMLRELGATPAARAPEVTAPTPAEDAPVSPLEALRAKRAGRPA